METLSRNLVARKRANASVIRETQSEAAPAPKPVLEAHVGLLEQMRNWFKTGK